jgi:diaminopimelate epimerase
LAKNNLLKVETALKVAKKAVKNEEIIVDTAKSIAKVNVPEPSSVSVKTIEKKVEAEVAKTQQEPEVIESEAPLTN